MRKTVESMMMLAVSLLALMALLIPGLKCENWTTVYYGVPVWRDATPPLFCASDPDIASNEPGNIWISTACLPSDPSPAEVPLNITEKFNIYKNYMVDEVRDDMVSLFNQALKPCVKLTPMCVGMYCNLTNTSTSEPTTTPRPPNVSTTTQWGSWGGENGTGQPLYNCSFNQTTEFRDQKKQMYSLFWREDIMEETHGNQSGYYIRNCNTSYITQKCVKSSFQPVPIHYCAPPGYAMLKCNDVNFTGVGTCYNVSAVTCTHGIQPLVATWLHLNGTYQPGNNTRIMMNGMKNESIVIGFGEDYHLNLTCIRPGNKTIRNLQIGAGMTFYSQVIVGGNTRKAYCRLDPDRWNRAIREAMKAMNEHWENKTGRNDTQIRWTSEPKGDLEVQTHWFQCQGEFFYCNLSILFQLNNNTINSSNIGNITSKYKGQWLACKIRQFVTQWGYVSKSIYLPPRQGHINCTSNITGLLIDGAMYESSINMTPSADVADAWNYELSRYKVVEIDPLSMAPTPAKRKEHPAVEKRALSLGISFLTFLSAAGTTMGAAATALTEQSRSLLAGIMQQQENLLRAVEAQQSLLQPSVWGIKQLQTRLSSLEKYLRDQTILQAWGCANRPICHTIVPWNTSWANGSLPDWENMTWQKWSMLVENDTYTIQQLLEQANQQQASNLNELMKLSKWDSLWSWFDISDWQRYIKIFVIVVAALIALRIVMFILNMLRRIRQGYSPLSPQILIPQAVERGPPDATEEGVGAQGKVRSVRYLTGFSSLLWDDLRNLVIWIYQILASLAWTLRGIGKFLWEQLQKAIQKAIQQARQLREVAARVIAYISYGIQELQAAATGILDSLAIFTWNWTEAVLHACRRVWREFLAIPRRIRQGAEILFN
ncbi:envelope glycoprotein [Simian immunodeficiency virus]|uniref:Envelope glycoprotein gp160 n=1 Tax=Simian immunodeficiency virus TaxID=11723 RepID=Q8JAG5_SIV|nr:envelope glycoprotein [Simian immunodeficiency virus]AAY59031.1 codon optimized envelope protein [synthetic construct]